MVLSPGDPRKFDDQKNGAPKWRAAKYPSEMVSD
jgi:hypothetical protein